MLKLNKYVNMEWSDIQQDGQDKVLSLTGSFSLSGILNRLFHYFLVCKVSAEESADWIIRIPFYVLSIFSLTIL